jgi:hypothetical protein
MPNPFLTKTLPPDAPFCDRETELAELLGHAEAGANVVLFSPRRCGKTSLVFRAQHQLAGRGVLPVYADLFAVDSALDAAARIARAALAALHARESLLGKGKRLLAHFTSFRPVFKPAEDGFDLTVEMAQEDPLVLLDRVLAELGEFAARTGQRFNVALDEFQEVCRLKDSAKIEGIMRGQIQKQRQVSYFFLGSRRGMLLAMFNDRKRPFFQSARFLELGPLPHAELAVFLAGLFAHEGKSCAPEVGQAIAAAVQGHPYYAQLLAGELFALAGREVGPDLLPRAVARMLDQERYGFEAVLDKYTPAQTRILRTLAEHPGEMLSREFTERAGLALGTVQTGRKKLKEEDLIEESPRGVWRVVDPVFALWLRARAAR